MTDKPKTLGHYRDLLIVIAGADSKAVEYLDKVIARHPRGRDEPVVADESQMLHMLGSMLTVDGKKR
jgi:hypothetical protein